ncbi:hypothetical protein BDZ97DRAFT_1916351 [Flammula alnicola]|nr:hypothetical protein BDZ97DRAFT_1916351 [Flammula alnicola]
MTRMVSLWIAKRSAETASMSGVSPATSVTFVSDPNVHFIILFDILYILGLVSVSVILITATLSSRIRRTSTWFMVLGSWFVTSLANLILLGQQTGPPPKTSVCLLQAMLIYATPVFASFTVVAFLLHVYLSIQLAVKSHSAISQTHLILFHAIPCGAFISVLVEVLILGLLNPSTIQRHPSGMYCHLSSSIPSKITAGITICAMLAFLVLGTLVVITLRRVWRAAGQIAALQDYTQISPDIATRIIIFGFCPIIALAVSFLQYLPGHNPVSMGTKLNIVLAVLPIVASLIFGSQRDIASVWMICNFRKEVPCDREIKPAAA